MTVLFVILLFEILENELLKDRNEWLVRWSGKMEESGSVATSHTQLATSQLPKHGFGCCWVEVWAGDVMLENTQSERESEEVAPQTRNG
ncbi:uncharacterized protein MONOS_13323 [Monocercomonoides exilis]|uniref:uncharacterized protein n=1 Tax=Monocercomonoides exilis TaxID=2049356 RepID=UPI00355A0436|nr:hypothetical protein MONOS_13323 [Monocercomonoides exilis]|eukprot:MONOS_13323.1-p1 / transcript=MONOS_13323.1 / gene=MONOS_13323 / organism=Monocercomonoides_exilis_PA203 / gene_product=unspecified product / transcript_product=unspecified product / location=Mono_scaffold00808:27635-27901(-) / protein_length=89 / sequence_SO=supercontig / SO=protein_coding / is_pseudo=false